MKRARILLADDHPVVLAGMHAILESQFEIVGTSTDGRALVQAALRLKPDLIVLDMTMPLLNGIDAAIEIRKSLPDAKLLFVTMHSSPAKIKAAFDAGATGYVLKSAASAELPGAINDILNGLIYVSPCLSTEQVELFQELKSTAVGRLTLRERETLQGIAEGLTSKEIAYSLNISLKTVAFHRTNIREKLGLRTTAELTKHAMDLGLVK